MSSVAVNGTTLYYERRGEGPAVLFISGATGDAGHWTEVADALADEFTVLTYDRRANSRSPRPEGWEAAPIDEQADDVAELLTALDLAPAVVYGNSSGAIILTGVALHHPEVLRGAIFHEPPYAAVASSGEAAGAERQALVEQGMAEGGPPAAMERFLRWVAGDEVFESLDDDLRARMLGNAEVFFGLELRDVMSYLPSDEQLAEVRVPCVVAAGADSSDPGSPRHWFHEAARWLADRLDAPLMETPGAHVPQVTHPLALAEVLRPILRKPPESARADA
jgi:pimeloyl-ACP methyl ester carboxylesterase